MGLLLGLTALSMTFGGVVAVDNTSAETPIVETSTSTETTPTTDTGANNADTGETKQDDTKTTFDFGEWLKTTFTPEVIASILSVITAIGAILKLVATMKDLAKQNKLSDSHILGLVNDAITKGFDATKNDVVQPLATDLEKILPVLDKFAKIMALSQENTAESRTAILNLISELGSTEASVKTTAEEAKKVIEEQTKAEAEKKENQKTALEEVSSSYDGTSI